MKKILVIAFALISLMGFSQNNLSGTVINESNETLPYVSVSLLSPVDSTFQYFAMSDENGYFIIKSVTNGDYLIQCALTSYETYYKVLKVTAESGDNLGVFQLKNRAFDMDVVNIEAEAIPIKMNGDTLEYRADSFKTQPDASTEDLLKKLPGVQVDDQGNIKAQGQDVQKVLVDGKEFFSSDPTVATKNIPADAIDKVQVYEGRGDQSELTGVDDGTREQTINLTLKKDKKNAWFGDITAGAGTDSRYKGSAKAYRFDPTHQFAMLGMLNNVNEFGFSINDYVDFQGGMGSMMGGGFRLGNDAPINFGQKIYGLNTSGAGGLNFTYEPVKNRRFNFSYMGNGVDQLLNETSETQNFLGESSFKQNNTSSTNKQNFTHALNSNIRFKIDSAQVITFKASASYNNANSSGNSISNLLENDVFQKLTRDSKSSSNQLNASADMNYFKTLSGKWDVLRFQATTNYNDGSDDNDWTNEQYFSQLDSTYFINQFQNNHDKALNYQALGNITRKVFRDFHLSYELKGNLNVATKDRTQNMQISGETNDVVLQYPFERTLQTVDQKLSFFKNSKDKRFNVSLTYSSNRLESFSNNDSLTLTGSRNFNYWLPQISFNNEYKTGRRVSARYRSGITAPSASQLYSALDNSNPQQVYLGNNMLIPEENHELDFSWMIFDQFSFTDFYIGFYSEYIKNKIISSRRYDQQLSQIVQPINTPHYYYSELSLDFSTPIRKLGTNIHIEASGDITRSMVSLNNQLSYSNTYKQTYTLSFDNRKKEIIDAEIGGNIELTDTKNNTLNGSNSFVNLAYFGSLSYNPSEHWSISIKGNVSNYTSQNFGGSIQVPMVQGSASYYFGASNRYALTMYAFDILDRNTGVSRTSELNYLSQSTTNIIGQYFMLSFKYRINKSGDAPDGMRMKRHR